MALPPLVTPMQKLDVGQDRPVGKMLPPSNPAPVDVGDCHDDPFHSIAWRLLFPARTKHELEDAHDIADRSSPGSTAVVEVAQLEDAHLIPLPAESTAQHGPDVPGAHDRDVTAPVVSLRVTGDVQVEPFQ